MTANLRSTLWVLLAVTLLVAGGSARGYAQQAASDIPGSTTCASTYTSGSGPTFFQWCVTANGNIISIQSPQGEEHILLKAGEGYQLCDFTALVAYTDYAAEADTGNWKASVITQPNGPNTFPLTIKRTTTDGKYTLTQKFSQAAADFTIKVATTVKNNTTSSPFLYVYRYADLAIDGGGNSSIDWFDQSAGAAWGYLQYQDGIMLSTGTPALFHSANATKLVPAHCDFPSVTTPANIDGGVYLLHGFTAAPQSSKTFTVVYRRF
jgi:hypothetical protein